MVKLISGTFSENHAASAGLSSLIIAGARKKGGELCVQQFA